jgi:hypothetical protein
LTHGSRGQPRERNMAKDLASAPIWGISADSTSH